MFKIEKHVPLPETKKKIKSKYPISDLEVGDSFFVPGDDKRIQFRVHQALVRFRKIENWKGKLEMRPAINEIGLPGLRVWRVK